MNKLIKEWNAIRIIRLLGGISLGIYAITSSDYVFMWLAGIFLFQAIFNISCCGAGGCSTGNNQKQVYKDEIIIYKPSKKH